MRIKKFSASSMKEGKSLVIKELGDDAIILSSRTTKNPTTGADIVEIVAALDDAPRKVENLPALLPQKKEAKPAEEPSSSNSLLFDEIASMKNMLQSISKSIKYKYSHTLSPVFSKLYEKLLSSEIDNELALEIIAKVSAININVEYSTAVEYAKEILSERISISEPIKESDKQKIIMFIGTTGTGKTSSLVKIAVVNKLLFRSNILILSADTYKVGGAEQLQTLASLVGIPFQSIYSPSEVSSIINYEKAKDYIFIDTTGKSHNDNDYLEELKELYDIAKPDITYLVLSATTSQRTTEQIIDKFSFIDFSSVILSKIDEAGSIGGLLSVLIDKRVPISYISTGQKIPEDIEPSAKKKLMEFLFD